MENIENVKLFIKSLDSSANKLSEQLKPLLSKSLDDQINLIEDPIAKIKFYNNYLYCLVSLIFAYLKSVGVDTNTHPIVKELARVKSYMNRLKELEAKISSKDTTKEDSEAAKNFLQNTLGGKINGGGAAVPEGLSKPAISKANFGKHTKFDEKSEEEEQEKGGIQASSKPITTKKVSKKPVNKVTKPVVKKSKKGSK